MALLIILLFIGIAIMQISRLKRAGRKREIVFFCISWLAGLVLLMMLSEGVKFPSVVGSIMKTIRFLGLHYYTLK